MRIHLALICAWVLASPAPATRADEPLRWAPVSDVDYWEIGLFSAGAFTATRFDRASPGPWTSGSWFDDSVRDSLRINSLAGRQAAAYWSGWGEGVSVAAPFLLDSLGLSWVRDRDPSASWRIAVIGLQALALAELLTQVTKVVVGRTRPYQQECAANPGYDANCNTSESNLSFFSGHASMAFTGAGLLCANHSELRLFGKPWADGAVCAGALSIATGTGLLRIAADQHWATDVLAGAVVGLASGWLIPTRFHEAEALPGRTVQHRLLVLPAGGDAIALTEMLRF